VFDLEFTQGSMDALTDAGVLISVDEAEREQLRIGDSVDVTLLDGESRRLTVQGTYDKDELAGAYTVTKQLYAQSGADQFDFSVFILQAPDVEADTAAAAITRAAAAFPTGQVDSRQDYIDDQAASIDQFVNLIYGLLALAVIIAVFGIANTLSLSIYERTRELGLLRAVGMFRSQVRSTVRWESIITALLGTVQGIVIGVLLGYAVVLALRDEGFGRFTLPVGAIGVILVLAIVAGLVAAARPARRASRLDILHAIATD
jgi:putative ABC transport system permease protein